MREREGLRKIERVCGGVCERQREIRRWNERERKKKKRGREGGSVCETEKERVFDIKSRH